MRKPVFFRILSLLSHFSMLIVLHAQHVALDNNFGAGGIVKTGFVKNTEVHAFKMICDSIGRTKLFGYSVDSFGRTWLAITAYQTNGTLDSSFGQYGKVEFKQFPESRANCVAELPNGDFLVGGDNPLLLRIDSKGSPVTDWGNAGGALFSNSPQYGIKALVVFPDSTQILVSNKGTITETDSIMLAKVDGNGIQDTAFGSSGLITFGHYEPPLSSGSTFVDNAVLYDSNRFVLSGYYNNGKARPILAMFKKDGTPDSSFAHDGFADFFLADGRMYAVQVDYKGRITAVGYNGHEPGVNIVVYRFFPDGKPDSTFGTFGRKDLSSGSYAYATALSFPDTSSILVVGVSEDVGAPSETYLNKLQYNGDYASSFNGTSGNWIYHMSKRNDEPWSIATDKYGHMFIGGTYFEYSSVSYFMVARLGVYYDLSNPGHNKTGPVTVFPNPTRDELNIQLAEPKYKYTIALYDPLGKEVLKRENETRLSLKGIETPGVYSLKILGSDWQYATKICIVR